MNSHCCFNKCAYNKAYSCFNTLQFYKCSQNYYFDGYSFANCHCALHEKKRKPSAPAFNPSRSLALVLEYHECILPYSLTQAPLLQACALRQTKAISILFLCPCLNDKTKAPRSHIEGSWQHFLAPCRAEVGLLFALPKFETIFMGNSDDFSGHSI